MNCSAVRVSCAIKLNSGVENPASASPRHQHRASGLQSINLVENSSGMCGVMLLLLGRGP